MMQNKYVVGKKYKINYYWHGKEDAIVKVISIKDNNHGKFKTIEVEYVDLEKHSFDTGSIIDDHTTPYEEEKTIVTEKVTKVIEAGCYDSLYVDEFKVGTDETVTIGLACSVFTKEEIGKLIKTLNEIHEVM